MANIGFKVMKAGADVSSTDVRDLLMSSTYSMLKYHMDTTASLTLVPGDTDKYVEVSHGLGYVPAFIAYFKYQGVQYFIPSLPRSGGFSEYAYAWSSSSVIRCGYAFTDAGYNEIRLNPNSNTNYWDSYFGSDTFCILGQRFGSMNGAIRFQNVTVPQGTTINSAIVDVAVDDKGAGAGNILLKTYGMDEDDTGSFTSDPMGRSQTTAFTTQNTIVPSVGGVVGIVVTSAVQEIVNRGGWASGNAMGFLIFDNGSPADVWIRDTNANADDALLKIVYGDNVAVEFRVIIFKDKLA